MNTKWTPKVSVIVPIYNVEDYLEQCLDSLVSQTLKDIEIICVDDGSPDRSAEIAEMYVKEYTNVTLLRKENGGQSSARNMALEIAKGTYVYFLDSDDYIEENALEKLYERMEADQLDMLFFNAVSFFEDDEIKEQNQNFEDYYNRKGDYTGVHTGQQMFSMMRQNGEFFVTPWQEFFRRSLIEDHHLRFYDGIIHEDNLFTFQSVMLAERTGYMDDKFYHRRVHDNSTMTTTKSMRNVEGYLVCYEEMLSFLCGRELEPGVDSVVAEFLYYAIYRNAYKIYAELNLKDEEAVLTKGSAAANHLLYKIQRERKAETDYQKQLKARRVKQAPKASKNADKSLDYRIGHALLFVPRKIKGGLGCIKDHGLFYTVKYGLKRFVKYTKIFRKIYVKAKMKSKFGKPLVSVIMPVYNVEEFLNESLESVLGQTVKNIELIAIDDGSTDRSLEILHEYAKKDSRLKVLTQENKFAGVARNLGLANAKGEYVIFLDSDDFFSNKLVEEGYYAAKMNKTDVVIWGAQHYHQTAKEFRKASWLLRAENSPSGHAFSYKDCPDKLYQITTPCPWTKMFRREFLKGTGLQFQGLRNSNDLFFIYSALAMAKRIYTVNKTLVNYRVGLENNLQATKKKAPLCFFDAYQAWYDKLVEIGKLDELRRSYVNVTLDGFLYNIRSVSDPDAKKVIFDKLKEAFVSLEISGYPEEYYYKHRDYKDMLLILNESYETYLEITQDR